VGQAHPGIQKKKKYLAAAGHKKAFFDFWVSLKYVIKKLN